MSTASLNATKLEAFDRVLGVMPDAVEQAVLRNQTVGGHSLDAVLDNLSKLLGVSKGEVLSVLVVSRARKSRNPTMNAALLDRAYSALDIYARWQVSSARSTPRCASAAPKRR